MDIFWYTKVQQFVQQHNNINNKVNDSMNPERNARKHQFRRTPKNAECVSIGLLFRRSGTPLEADWYFEVRKSFKGGLLLEETDLGISKARNSNLKWTKMKNILRSRKLGVLLTPISKVHGWIPRRNFEDRTSKFFFNKTVCGFLEHYETSKVYGFWTSSWTRFQRLTTLSGLSFLTKILTLLWFCGFESLEPLLRQTSYLKAHGFPDANKRWERIKVRGSKRKVEKRQREEPPKLDFEGSRLSRRLLMEFRS
ncbi:hypothetical protein RCL_jg16828.t1 [Rhizophagus clarus]|uniref:Uncharacterized protein n=1 Tax=Rhizophagus clarus TaxID=94130 RepID=A0A8H3LB09_9GLOM|nr:hypothetical protein RCL_jg16828.t1 [Rhizophagus clarus]